MSGATNRTSTSGRGRPNDPRRRAAARRAPTSRPVRAQRRRAEHRAEHLRYLRAVRVDLEHELAVLAEHPVPRPVEAVHVALEAVPQRDARELEPATCVVDQARRAARAGRRRPREGSSPPPPRAARHRAPAPTWAGTRSRARPAGSACGDGCGGRSARRAAPEPPTGVRSRSWCRMHRHGDTGPRLRRRPHHIVHRDEYVERGRRFGAGRQCALATMSSTTA